MSQIVYADYVGPGPDLRTATIHRRSHHCLLLFICPHVKNEHVNVNMPRARPDSSDDTFEAAVYLAAMSASLAKMARSHGHQTLGYLLEMANLEAENIQQNAGGADTPLSPKD